MRQAGVQGVAVVEDMFGWEIQAEDDVGFVVVEFVVNVGVGFRVAPGPEADYHETSGSTGRLSEEHPAGRWLPLGDAF